MAKILLEKMADEEGVYVEVKSRGILANPGDGISRGTYAVLLKEGIDSSYHQARSLEGRDIQEADAILTMTKSQSISLKAQYPDAADKISPLSQKDVPDPFGGSIEVYERTLENLRPMLEELLEKIKGDTL